MKYYKGDKLFHGWSVTSCDLHKSAFSMYTISKSVQGNFLSCSLFVIPVQNPEHEKELMLLLDFYKNAPAASGLLRVFEYEKRSDDSGSWYLVRAQQCSALSMMRLSESQCLNMAQDLLPALVTFRSNMKIAEDLQEENIFLTDAGVFRLANFVCMGPHSSWFSIHQDLQDLCALMRKVTSHQKNVSQAFDMLLQQCTAGQFPSIEDFEKALIHARNQSGKFSRKNKSKKIVQTILSGFSFLILIAVLFSTFLKPASAGMEEQSYAHTFRQVIRSQEQHEETGNLDTEALLEKKNWILDEENAVYVKEIDGARLAYKLQDEKATYEIHLSDSSFDYNSLIDSLEGIAPDIVHHGFIASDNFNEFLGLSDHLLVWLKEAGEYMLWEDGTGKSYVFDGEDLHVSYHEDTEKSEIYYILSDYTRAVLMKSIINTDQTRSFIFDFYPYTL